MYTVQQMGMTMYVENILADSPDIRVFLLYYIGIGIGHKNLISVGL